MRKMKTATKLMLAKETLRTLTVQQLAAAQGGSGAVLVHDQGASVDAGCSGTSGSGGNTTGSNSQVAHCNSRPPSLSNIIISE
jgi:hypothetical protein